MKIQFLGSGAAFTLPPLDEDGQPKEPRNWQSNLLVIDETEERPLLIDCGGDVRHALHDVRRNHRDIGGVYITHLHADHVGGLEWFAFLSFFDPGYQGRGANKRPQLLIHEENVEKIWQNSLQGGLESIQGRVMTLEDYFEVIPLSTSRGFRFGTTDFQLVCSDHVNNGSWIMSSFGLLFETGGVRVFFTADVQRFDQLSEQYAWADVIFHDCEISPFPTTVHTHFTDLGKLDPAIRSKIWLYGFQPGPRPDARSLGFRGFIERGQVFDFDRPETLLPR